jgi:peptidyl-prolyl cis-trans isomerase NIMA-interacting 1
MARKISSQVGLMVLVAGYALLTGCAGSATGQAQDSQAQARTTSPGQQCLEDARSKRTPAAAAPRRIRVAHILVRHTELKDPAGATRAPEAACLRALEALNKLKGGADWEPVATEFSDSKTSDLGSITKEDVTPAFADAAFELDVNQLSYVVETDRGFHVILRLE